MPLESLNINGVAVDTCINYLTSVLTCVLFLPSLITSASGLYGSHVRKFLFEAACSGGSAMKKGRRLSSSNKRQLIERLWRHCSSKLVLLMFPCCFSRGTSSCPQPEYDIYFTACLFSGSWRWCVKGSRAWPLTRQYEEKT